jgi:glycosyltransferase involved in cell wall biosynthesis
MRPLFSIGITTYNRNDLLKECLNSIIEQDFQDVEMVIGNDYQKQPLSEDLLGIHDPRIRILNHPANLGPIANANALIAAGRGRYFTLLADDDMHTRHFLHVMYDLLSRYGYPPCIFASFTSDMQRAKDPGIGKEAIIGQSRTYRGREFLHLYLSRTVKTIGCYGVFEMEYLKRIGGMRQLGHDRSMYGEVPLVIASGLLDEVAYVNHPLVFFRDHQGSLSNTSADPGAYASSQKAFLQECIGLLRAENLRPDFQANLFFLLKWFMEDFVEVMHRSGSIYYKRAAEYAIFMKQSIEYLKGSPYYWKAMKLCMSIPIIKLLMIGKGRLARTKGYFWVRRNLLKR